MARRSRPRSQPQKGKSRKRRPAWHGGGRSPQVRRYLDAEPLPDVGSGADPTTGAPRPLRRNRPSPHQDAV